jgi:hypothetical protein
MRRQIPQPEFENTAVGKWPSDLKAMFLTEADRIATTRGRQFANMWLATKAMDINNSLAGLSFAILEDDSALKAKASAMAWEGSIRNNLKEKQLLATCFGILPPSPAKYSLVGQAKRLGCPMWWRRQLRRHLGRHFEDRVRREGLVRFDKCLYISDTSLRRRRRQRASLAQSIERKTVECDDSSVLDLSDAVDSSVTNPHIRRTELMVRTRGMEDIAKERGDLALFFTLTVPSAYHAQLRYGHRNPRYAGSSVSDAMTFLNQNWQRARAALRRKDILYYGMRVTEPHHDGTPHFHALLFCAPHDADNLAEIIRHYWLQDDGDEHGAKAHRASVKKLNLNTGSAVGYIAKYIAKNIDGFNVGEDFEGECRAAAERVEAWASTHRIRQFQQLGGPVISLWRELRRLRDTIEIPAIEYIRCVACNGDYGTFVNRLGGIALGHKVKMRLWKQRTGEITQYDEIRGPEVVGIQAGSTRLCTRDRKYRVKWNSKVSSVVRSILPWTRGNNCTPYFTDQRLSRTAGLY